MCFSGTALRCMPGRSHSPGRGPGLTESASALRTSDAGLLPESLCRMRCGRRMQGRCRSHCAGSVADVGCRVVAGVIVQEALRTSDAGLLPESLCRKRCGRRMPGCCLTDSCRFLWHSRHSRGKSRSPGLMSEASSATRCRCVVLRPFDISHTSFLSTT